MLPMAGRLATPALLLTVAGGALLVVVLVPVGTATVLLNPVVVG